MCDIVNFLKLYRNDTYVGYLPRDLDYELVKFCNPYKITVMPKQVDGISELTGTHSLSAGTSKDIIIIESIDHKIPLIVWPDLYRTFFDKFLEVVCLGKNTNMMILLGYSSDHGEIHSYMRVLSKGLVRLHTRVNVKGVDRKLYMNDVYLTDELIRHLKKVYTA